jgi:signal transduction histidine kinase
VRDLGRRWGVDALIVAAALAGVLEVALRPGAKLPTTSLWLAVPAAALVVLMLLGWRVHGAAAGASLWLLAAAISLIDGRLIVTSVGIQAAGIAAAYLLGNARNRRQAQAGLPVIIVCTTVIVGRDPKRSAGEFVFVLGLFTVTWVAGYVLRQRTSQSEAAVRRAARLEMQQEENARQAIAEERARIARELHDVVGHCVSVMTVQASAVRRVLTAEQDEEREALMSVEKVGREALAEMRRLVGILREPSASPDMAPPPTLRDLDVLVSHARTSGLCVRVTVEGDLTDLPASIDLTAYRIVQEGLTNTIRHAHANTAQVRIRHRAGGLDLEISDDGIGLNGGRPSTGHGLLGMKERVEVFGGRLEVGPCAAGGYRLRARLPVPT